MHNTRLSDSLNGNKGRQKTAGLEPVSGVSRLGHSVGHAQGLREGTTEASRSCHDQTAGTSRRRGGQASLSTFGVPGFAGRRASGPEAHPQEVLEAKAPSPRQQPPARRVAVPTVVLGLAMPKCWQPAPAPIRLRLSRERLGVFLALATIEQRSLEDVLADNVAETAGRLLRTRHELHLDAYDAQVLAEYIDGLAARQEAWEAQETESVTRAATTPAMRQAAIAADERERHPAPDLEEWDRTLPFGHVELAVALD